MIEPKGELKFSKVDDYTIEVCDDNGCKIWTLETLDHSLVQIEKDKDARLKEIEEAEEEIDVKVDERMVLLKTREEYYKNILGEASKLGIVRKNNTLTVHTKINNKK